MQASMLELAFNPVMSKPAEASRVATYKQPRGRKIPPLISEFVETKVIRCRNSDEPKPDDKNKLTADFYGVPAGSKMLRKAPVDKLPRHIQDNVGFWYLQRTAGFSHHCQRGSTSF